ncbi:MAG: flavin reductase family protein [Desulfovibrionaceae bacterium]|nr:flavin reductase family protein [Desulfovibrionaceae bacterium]MBF0513443.1 flavin reductase family protein [Desulfovibrionaceae bacterium]
MKTKLGGVNALYPSLTVIVGALVEGRPNFIAVAHVGIMNHGSPQYISMGLGKSHYSNRGIKENGEFSVNLPPESLVAETDYVGIVSGKNVDKSTVFELFYGELPAAPMIKACPVNMECRLERIVDFPTHEVFVGEIVQTYADEEMLTGGKVDVTKVKPLLFDMASVKYYALGPPVAQCWNIGKSMKKK